MSDHISEPPAGWTRYTRARATVYPDLFPPRSRGHGIRTAGVVADKIDLTLGVEHNGNISVSGYLYDKGCRSIDALLRVEMTLEEAQRLRDLLVWALADLPSTAPPPG
jgi:hypothetical protein